jgi:hypothetical protein
VNSTVHLYPINGGVPPGMQTKPRSPIAMPPSPR